MALGITVTGDALLGYSITVTDADSGDRLRVLRRDVSGYYPDATVRGADFMTPAGDTEVFIDYEAPFNTELHFIAQSFDVSDLTTPTATAQSSTIDTVLPNGFAIITDPLDAAQRLAVAMSSLDKWSLKTRVLGQHQVLQRHNSVISTDVESGRTGTMIVSNLEQFAINWDDTGPYLPYTVVAHANWNTIFRTGRTLLFRNTHQESGFDDMYFKLLGRSPSRNGSVGSQGGSPWLTQDLDFEEQDGPPTATTGLSLGTWNVVFQSNVNWDEVYADHADWTDVLLNPSA